MTLGYAYGKVDPLAAAARYTTLTDVKAVLGIPVADTSKDDRITEAIVAAEYAIDVELGRSFPDPGSVIFSGPYTIDTDSDTDPSAGELNVKGGTYRLAKVDDDTTDHTATPPVESSVVRLPFQTETVEAWVEAGTVTDETTFWSFPGTVVRGTVPASVTQLVTITLQTQAQGGIGRVLGIPAAVSSVARAASVGIFKSAEAPFGSAGSDDWLGTISVPQIVAEQVRRNPQLMGYKVSFGVR